MKPFFTGSPKIIKESLSRGYDHFYSYISTHTVQTHTLPIMPESVSSHGDFPKLVFRAKTSFLINFPTAAT